MLTAPHTFTTVRAPGAGHDRATTMPWPACDSSKLRWTGWILSGVAFLLLAFDATGKLLQVPAVVEGTVRLGYPAPLVATIGVLEVLCLLAYAVPGTAVLGAVLLTGFLGGAVATHLRIGDPLWTHMLFPVYTAVFVWAGVWLRDPRVRSLLPLRRTPGAA